MINGAHSGQRDFLVPIIPNKNLEASKYGVDPNRHWGSYSIILASPRLHLRLTLAAESMIRSGHPWLFADSIREQNREGEPGELAVVYDRRNRFLAIGLFDPDSPIRLRILHAGKPVMIDDAWWRESFSAAVRRRENLFDDRTNG